MLAQFITEKRIRIPQRLDAPAPDGFVRRALALLGQPTFGVATVSPAGTRRDFLQALQVLGAKSNRYRLAGGDPLPRTIPLHISCPYQTWLQVFGKPRQLEKHGSSSSGVAVHLWKQECKDGAVTCIGQVSERLPGLRWVVVMRVGFYG
jgi:hypothetical protein